MTIYYGIRANSVIAGLRSDNAEKVTVHGLAPDVKHVLAKAGIGGFFSLLALKGRKKVRHRRIKNVSGYLESRMFSRYG